MTRKGNQIVNNEKVKKKKRYKVDYIRVILIITLVYFSITFVRQQLSINEYDLKIANVKEDITESKSKIEDLREVETRVNDADYIEEVARKELGLVKPYEKIFINVNK